IGQNTDTGFLYNDLPVRLNKWGDIDIDGFSMQTSELKIFSGGDCVTGPSTVVAAIGAGRRAAEAINEFVTQGYVKPSHEDYACSRGSLEDLPRAEFEALPSLARAVMPELEVEDRLDGFPEVELGLTEAQARTEASRCLTCGCSAQNSCALRKEASAHQVHFQPTLHVRPRSPIVRDHQFIIRDQNKCISCGLCVAACAEIMGPGVLAFQFREGQMRVCTSTGEPLNMTDCVSCGQCVRACPTGALDYVRERGAVFTAINDPSKVVVGFVAPAVRAHVAKEYGLSHMEVAPFVAGMMKKIGFDKSFDFVFAADLTIMEETTELFGRLANDGVLPLYTSCCPGWVNYAERRYPGIIPHLSSCKSPQQMMGATVKAHFAKREGIDLDDLYVVSIVPCMAKKSEAARPEFAPEGIRDVDAVLTTTEFLEMTHMLRLEKEDIEPAEFDLPYKQVSGAGVLFGSSGGVAEAATRMAVEKLTGEPLRTRLDFQQAEDLPGVKVAEVEAPGRTLRIAAISGLGNADPVIKRLIAGDDMGFDLVEIMACPGGCINGAGHPKPKSQSESGLKTMILSNIDEDMALKDSQQNPDILRLYEDFYGEPNSHLAHDLLHTTYAPFRPQLLEKS
ncbi:MAG TPA: [FeFe] hydrogenase, group A, partial [Demequina sp.]|nr:[FeFe] hydrogenase, group A [Demequina sp.]